MCHNEIGLCAHNINVIPSFIVNTIGKGPCDRFKRKRMINLTYDNFLDLNFNSGTSNNHFCESYSLLGLVLSNSQCNLMGT